MYTSHLVSSIVSLNQAAKAKTNLAQELRGKMEEELAKYWPEDVEKYREIMGRRKEDAGVKEEGKDEAKEEVKKEPDAMEVDNQAS